MQDVMQISLLLVVVWKVSDFVADNYRCSSAHYTYNA